MSETDNPSTWHQGFLKLSPTNPPCPGLRAEDWREIHTRAKVFFDGQDIEAETKGWTGISLFGIQSVVGAANVSASGGLDAGRRQNPRDHARVDQLRAEPLLSERTAAERGAGVAVRGVTSD